MPCRWMLPAGVVVLAAVSIVPADAQPLPAASGRVFEAAEGDVVVLPRNARVTVVTRTQVHARLVYVAAQQTLLLLTDPALGFGTGMPDAKGVRRWQLRERWPLEPRWEGNATIDDYGPWGGSPFHQAIHTDRGTILIGPLFGETVALTPAPIAVVRTAAASSRAASGTFDDIEQAWLTGGDDALRGPRGAVRMQSGGGGIPGGVSGGVPGAGPVPPGGAVRVGGNIRAPQKVQDALPVYPELAQKARVQGVVIVEITIDREGAVSNAQVLRSIPLLDQAALDAVRQWRYEPTLLNGVPVPVIMTATVNFALQPRAVP